METPFFEHLQKLYDDELYSCVIPVASLLCTLLQNDRSFATPEIEYQIQLMMGNAYYHERQYRLAIKQFDSALMLRKTMLRYKVKHANLITIESSNSQFTELESRYKLAYCYRELDEHTSAISTIQAIPANARTPKMNLLLGQLLHYGNAPNTVEAVATYKDLLRESPLAFQAIEALLELGVDGLTVNSIVFDADPAPENIEWLNVWIKAYAQMYDRKHLEASKTFQHINDKTKFHQNEFVLTMIGKCLYYYGSFPQAQQHLETAVMLNPHSMETIMPLAVVYEYNQKLPELEKLSSQMTNANEFCSEHWFVLAQNFYANGKLEKASSFTHKAITIDARNIEAQLLRGKICLQMKRFKDAVYFFRAAQCIANYRFEVYKGLFHCYVGMKRIKEAQTMCSLSVRYFRTSPRSYVMFARTLFHSTNIVARKSAKKIVSKALEIDEHYAPAVALLAEICQSDGDIQEAIEILKKQVVNYPHHKLFTMLGEILSAEKDLSSALEYFTVALSMEPTYHRALEGVNALGQASRANSSRQDTEGSVMTVSTTNASSTGQDEEWPIECDEQSMEAIELSSPAVAQDDGESDTFSDPFWQDVDADLTN